MKYTILIILTLLLLIRCGNQRKGVEVIHEYTAKDSIEIELKLFDMQEGLYSLLDTIIASVIKCPDFDSKNNEFVLSLFLDENNQLQLFIEYGNIENFDYTKCAGVVYYGEFQFNIAGNLVESYFKESSKTIVLQCINPENLTIDIDDSGFRWQFIEENGDLKCISYVSCNMSWFDEKYFRSE